MKSIISVLLLMTIVSSLFGQSEEWGELHLKSDNSVWADSSLTETIGGKVITYGPEALFDGENSTPWVEGVEGSGEGEGVTILTNRTVTGLSIVNGFALSERLFYRNNRLKTFSISFIAGLTAPGLVTENDYHLYFSREKEFSKGYQVKDSMEKQNFSLNDTKDLQLEFYKETIKLFAEDYPELYIMILDDLGISPFEEFNGINLNLIMELYGFFALSITIREVYDGTNYDDTCISEIELTLEDF
jgi:hypothetical protein